MVRTWGAAVLRPYGNGVIVLISSQESSGRAHALPGKRACDRLRAHIPMPKSKAEHPRDGQETGGSSISLKTLAQHLGLSSATVSLVINRSPAAKSIPPVTQDRIRAAPRQLNYPNLMARSLHQK